MNRKVLVVVLALAVVLLTTPFVGSTFAKRTKTPYEMGLVGWVVDPGTPFVSADKIVHDRGSTGAQNLYGTPWGDGTAASTGIMNLNMMDGTGSGMGHVVDTYTAGTFEGIMNYKVNGMGMYTYNGPTIIYEGLTVEAGDMFFGTLFSGFIVKHGTSGSLDGLQMRGTMMGVSVIDTTEITEVPPNPDVLFGKNLVWETGVYW